MMINDQPLLIALVAAQFAVHALGWTMATRLFHGWRAAEGQFAVAWAALALGLASFVPALESGHLVRNLGSLLVVAAAALFYRGFAMHWQARRLDGASVALLLLLAVVQVASMGSAMGHGWRVAAVSGAGAVLLAATAWMAVHKARSKVPVMAWLLALSCAALASALLGHAGQALQAAQAAAGTKVSLDAPGRSRLGLVVLVMFVGGLLNLAQIRLVLGRVLERLVLQAQTDALTGVSNRRGLLSKLEDMHERALRGGHSYVMLMIDIDHFKQVNDRHGHVVGDGVLKQVAIALRDSLRVGDVVGRWGGEEFCVLLPRITLSDAVPLAERVAQSIAASSEPRVTLSVGVAQAQALGESAEQLLRRADEALYAAKAGGRNRVVASAGLS